MPNPIVFSLPLIPKRRLWWPVLVAVGFACSGDAATEPDPTLGASLLRFSTLAAGARHTCGIDREGVAYCWGFDGHAQLGIGFRLGATGTPLPTAVFTDLRFSNLAAGERQTCGISADGPTHCWGTGLTRVRVTPERISQTATFESVVSGWRHMCGRSAAGDVMCWGAGDAGQLGTGAFGIGAGAFEPGAVSGMLEFASIATGIGFTCGIDLSGRGYCWGAHDSGQLGGGDTPDGPCTDSAGDVFPCSPTPMAIAGDLVLTSLTAGFYHACGTAIDETVHCWGDNALAQLAREDVLETCDWADGPNQRACSRVPVAAGGDLTLRSVVAGGFHTCGLTDDGAAYCWGANAFGQLGIGRLAESRPPTAVTGDLRFVSLTAGQLHTCGLTADGEGFCWGSNEDGQLGTDKGISVIPTKIGTFGQ